MAKLPKKIERLYLVEWLCWGYAGIRNIKNPPPYLQGKARKNRFTGALLLARYQKKRGAVPVKAFLDRATAEAHSEKANDAAWEGINPFHFGSKLADWTSLDLGRLRDWMLDLGLQPPDGKFSADKWQRWYDRVHDQLDEVQRRAIRQGLDRVQFYQVSELTE